MRRELQLLRTRGPRALAARTAALLRPPRRKGNVLMLHNGRSGTTVLGEMLDQHPDVFWDGETLEKLLHRLQRRRGVGFEELWQAIDLTTGLREIDRRMRRRAAGRLFGTEVQDYQVLMLGTNVAEYIARMKQSGFTRFILVERNYLRKVVSSVVATRRDRFHVPAGHRPQPTRVRIDPDRLYIGHRFTTLLGAMRQFRAFRRDALAALAGEPLLELSYERDIERDPRVASNRVCAFLGQAPHHPRITLAKTTDVPLSEIVENLDEVRAALVGSEFEAELAAL